MTSPVLSLRSAIRSLCLADAVLAALMDREIRDEAPRHAAPVYATFGPATLSDASSSTETGHLQEASLRVWAKPGSAATALRAADRLAALLDDAAPTLAGHRLVALSCATQEVDRDDESGLVRITLRLRAVTELI